MSFSYEYSEMLRVNVVIFALASLLLFCWFVCFCNFIVNVRNVNSLYERFYKLTKRKNNKLSLTQVIPELLKLL